MSLRAGAERALRIASLVLPSWGAWYVVFSTKHAPALVQTVGLALGPLWGLVTAVLALRLAALALRGRREGASTLEQIDVLTSSGVALVWTSSAAIVLAVVVGYASFAVVGLLGTAVFHLTVLYSLVVLRGSDPFGARTITRRFSPDVVTEGDEVVEEIRFDGARIPLGFRLFVTGRIGPRWATSRHVLETSDSGGEVVVETDLGAALRGEHDVEPLRVWLEDVLGLCRSPVIEVESRRLEVLPRVPAVDAVAPLLERGHGPRAARMTPRLPTEGLFDLREYKQGDDVRRIHWVRSLAAGELIVRLPDEVPPDRPEVRLVLDTYFPEGVVHEGHATAELLDVLVSVWLGVARSLADAGVRVKLVTAIAREDEVKCERLAVARRDLSRAQRLGASVRWQGRMPVDELLTDEATIVVSRGLLSRPVDAPSALRWIVLEHEPSDHAWTPPNVVRLPFPVGSRDNDWSERRRVAEERWRGRVDHGRALVAMRQGLVAPPVGSLSARRRDDGSVQIARIA